MKITGSAMQSTMKIWNQIPQRTALQDYPWAQEADVLLAWLKTQASDMYPFIFDVMMSLAYIESTENMANALETCPHTPPPYNSQIVFTNLCACCYQHKPALWQFQKTAKPSSGVLGKISSEMTLKFVECTNSHIAASKIAGGTGTIDAVLLTTSSELIMAEIKSAPWLHTPSCSIFQKTHSRAGTMTNPTYHTASYKTVKQPCSCTTATSFRSD